MAMSMAMSVGGTRSLSSGAFFSSQVWSRGSEIRTRASMRISSPDTKASMAENYKEAEIGSREMTHSSKRSRTICNVTANSANAEIELKEATGRCLSGPRLRGKPLPFGATVCEEGVNFAVHSSGATAVALCLFTESDLQQLYFGISGKRGLEAVSIDEYLNSCCASSFHELCFLRITDMTCTFMASDRGLQNVYGEIWMDCLSRRAAILRAFG